MRSISQFGVKRLFVNHNINLTESARGNQVLRIRTHASIYTRASCPAVEQVLWSGIVLITTSQQ